MFEMILAEAQQGISPANWGMSVNRIGLSISATWLIAWPSIVFIFGSIWFAIKYIALRRKTGAVQR